MTLNRRPLIVGSIAALASPVLVLAQPAAGKVWRIGVLSLSIERLDFFFDVLAALGYQLGGNLIVDYKFAQGRVERLPSLAADLVAAKPDLLLGPSNVDAAQLKHATSTIPMVMLKLLIYVRLLGGLSAMPALSALAPTPSPPASSLSATSAKRPPRRFPAAS